MLREQGLCPDGMPGVLGMAQPSASTALTRWFS